MVFCAFAASGYARGGAGTACFTLVSYSSLGLGVQYLYCGLKNRHLMKCFLGFAFVGAGMIGLWAIFK